MAIGRVKLGAVAAGAGVITTALWWRRHPSACPYSQRFWVQAPHPFITRERLREILEPTPGERVLEIGPGTGYYSLPVARWLAPGGTLEVLDVQQEMLDHTVGRARDEESRTSRRGSRTPASFPTPTTSSTPPTS